MCGIAGAVFWSETPRGVDPRVIVERMTRALAHRGPDGEGVVACDRIGTPASGETPTCVLGHRRLAIIDLSDRAAQPMASRSVPIWATFNGEIYNFRQVRKELERIGRVFRTDSDTEVLVQGYEEWGGRVIERLRGMFAFAIWDGQTNQLVLARDRLGIKPLYLHRTDDGVLFASEIRALLASELIPRRLDPVALDQFLAYQAVPPPRTLVQGIELLLPGHVAVAASPGRFEQHQYWDLLHCGEPHDEASDRDAHQRRIRELLLESIGLHLVSDVPVGVFLSGGVDSSAIVALMREAGVVPRTFCVTFPGTAFDESPYARAVASAYDTEHVDIPLEAAGIPAQIAAAAASIDHPSGDGINTCIISQAVRAAGMKVALSGLGGDEFFGGYPSFQRFSKYGPYARAWGRSPEPLRSSVAAAVRAVGDRSIGTLKTAALLETDGSLPQMFPIMRALFSPAQRSALLAPEAQQLASQVADPYVSLLQSAEERADNGLGTMSLVSFAEARTYMHDVLLRDTDQMSMRWGLEVRVPLLDHRVVEYLMSLPDSVKEPGDRPKRLLLDSLAQKLPEACVGRAKQGFVLPFDLWMRGELRAFCERHLQAVGDQPFLRRDAVDELWGSFLDGDRRVSWSRPWTLVALDAWLDQTQIQG